MAEYIEREAFIKWVEDTYCKPCEEEKRDYNHCRCGSCQYDDMMRDAESFESADIQLVRHGRWKFKKDKAWVGNGKYWCSVCRYGFASGAYHKVDEFKFCPMCGAKMDGVEE